MDPLCKDRVYHLYGCAGRDEENSFYGYGFAIANVGLTGTGKHHFEYNLGVYYLANTARDVDGVRDRHFRSFNSAGPLLFAGYRYQRPQGGLMFRAGVGWPEIASFGLGLSVNPMHFERDHFEHSNINISLTLPFPYISIEKFMTQTPRISYYGRLNVGTLYVYQDFGPGAGLSLVALTGKSQHHLEITGGAATMWYVWRDHDDNKLKTEFSRELIPTVSLGYRLQDFSKRHFFRAGVGFPEVVFLGFGTSI